MNDEGWCRTQREYNINLARCRQLQESRTGVFVTRGLAERYHLKAGDAFPVLTQGATRADGGKLLAFHGDRQFWTTSQVNPRASIIGNYSYFDQTRPASTSAAPWQGGVV